MTVQSQTSRADYNGNGATTVFAVPFYFLLDTDLQVIRTDNSTTPATVVTLVLNSDYTVTGAGNPVGGSITATIAPTNTQRLSILRNVPYTQLKHYVPNDPFPAASHEMGLDKLTMEVQQLAEVQSRALTLAPNTTGTSTQLPIPEANALIGWNPTASALQNIDPVTLATVVAFGTANADQFTGNGAQKDFTLAANPGLLANLDVSIGGITQSPGTDYTWNGGTTLSFSVAPPNGVKVLARYMQGMPQAFNPDLSNSTDPAKGAALVAHAAQSVDNVAVLRTLLKTSASQWARTSGYYTKGDGGGGDYYLDITDTTSADNGGTIIVAADGGRWKLSYSGVLSIRQWGAKGDGVTDDSAAFIAANAVGPFGIPSGTFVVNANINIITYVYFWTFTSKLSVSVGKVVTFVLQPTIPITFVFPGAGLVKGIREVYPEWWGAVGNGTTDDILALEAAHTCVMTVSARAYNKPTIYLSQRYAVSRSWIVTPSTSVPLRILGNSWQTNANIVCLSTFSPAGPVLWVQGPTDPAQVNADWEIRGLFVIPQGGGISFGAATQGLLIGGSTLPSGLAFNLSGFQDALVDDVTIVNFPINLEIFHARQIKFTRSSFWYFNALPGSRGMLIHQTGGFSGDLTFEACQWVAPNAVSAGSHCIDISSDNGVYAFTSFNSVAGIVFDGKCVFYFGNDKGVFLHAGSGSWLTDIWFNPGCQFEGSSLTVDALWIEATGGVNSHVENIHVNDCYFSTTTHAAINVSNGGTMQSLFIQRNWCDRQGGPAINIFSGVAANLNGVHVGFNVVSNNNSTGVGGAGILFNAAGNFTCTYNVQQRNVGAPGVVGATYPGHFIEIDVGSVNFQCVGNTNGGFAAGGVLLDNSGAVTKTVTGNI